MIDIEAVYLESRELQRLADLRAAGGWQFTVHESFVTGVRPWPDGSADVLVLNNFTAAQARRTNPIGGVVWRQKGSLDEIADALLALPTPDDPGAPAEVIAPSPGLWTSE